MGHTELDTTNSSAAAQHELLGRLANVGTPREVAAAIVWFASASADCERACVVWAMEDLNDPESEPQTQLSTSELDLARAAVIGGQLACASSGRQVAFRLCDEHAAVLLVTATSADGAGVLVEEASAQLRLAGRHMCRAIETEALKASHGKLERSESLQRALFAISDLAGSDLPTPEMLRGVQTIVGTLMYAENFFIVLHNDERDTLRFLYHSDAEDRAPRDPLREISMKSRENSLTWYLIRDSKPLMGTTEHLRTQVSGPLNLIGPEGFDWLGVPMLREGRAVGAIVVQSYQAGIGFSDDDRALLEFVGSHILIALERKLGKEDLEERVRLRTVELADANHVLQLEIVERQRAERLQAALFQIAQLATIDISQTEFYSRVHAAVSELINADNFYIALLSEDQSSLDFPYYVDATQRSQPSRPLGRGLSEYVIRSERTLRGMTDDIVKLGGLGEIELQTAGSPAASWLGVPLFVDGGCIGIIVVQSYDERVVYSAADQELLSFVASQVANSLHRRRAADILQRAHAELEERVQERTRELSKEIVERERIQDELKYQVMHDTLTGLPNRGYLRDRLERVLTRLKREPDRHCALLFMDVDRFKVINDSLGHLVGDDVLKEVARRLLTCVREPDLVARLSGDEFAILLEDVPVPATAIKVAQRVLRALGLPLTLGGTELAPSASIGITIGDHHYQLADEVLRDADAAMYRAKKQGRARFELFDESMQQAAVDVLALEVELRAALQQDHFEPYLQPVIRLDTGEAIGYEALIRWNHQTRGVLAPGAFIKVAEENGSMEAIDWRMFELSCEAAVRFARKDVFLTINVSPRHFHRAEFCGRLLEVLERTGLAPQRLFVELTEGSLIEHPEQVRGALEQLRDAGIGAALDDFGTGYSSLSYLHTFPLRILKIDRAFVCELGRGGKNSSVAVVAAVIALARALDMEVIAEGIETQEQSDELKAMGCKLGQGYLLGRPAPVGHWLAEERNAAARHNN
jgi:diguanylate cyclase (GGDEF)-like protein